jgi:hypothetical protein
VALEALKGAGLKMLRRLKVSCVALVTTVAALAGVVVLGASTFGGSVASASTLSAVDCSQAFGGDYLASVTGNAVTVNLNADCTSGPYYLVVYSATDNAVEPVITSSGTQLCPSPVDPNSYCSFPSQNDFPEFFQSIVEFTGTSAVAQLPSSCWQVDVITAPLNTPSVLENVTSGPGAFVWGEDGPPFASCTPASPPSAVSPLTIGYWKNHTAAMAPLLPQSLGSYVVSSTQEGVAVLSNPAAKYAENQLAAQLLAAELNVAAGATTCPALTSTIQDANSLLKTIGYSGPPSELVGPGSPYRTQAINDASVLESYNSGTLC